MSKVSTFLSHTSSSQSKPTALQEDAAQIETLEDHKGILMFMSVSLVIGFALFAVLGYVMVQAPSQYASEAKDHPYVSRYTMPSATPSEINDQPVGY